MRIRSKRRIFTTKEQDSSFSEVSTAKALCLQTRSHDDDKPTDPVFVFA